MNPLKLFRKRRLVYEQSQSQQRKDNALSQSRTQVTKSYNESDDPFLFI